jgi:hypothetical protein
MCCCLAVLQINGQCLASRISSSGSSSWPSPAYGGPCDQFGALCRMWEVVDFLELEPGIATPPFIAVSVCIEVRSSLDVNSWQPHLSLAAP